MSTTEKKRTKYDVNFIVNTIALPVLGDLFLALELSSDFLNVPDLDKCFNQIIIKDSGGANTVKTRGDFCVSVENSTCFYQIEGEKVSSGYSNDTENVSTTLVANTGSVVVEAVGIAFTIIVLLMCVVIHYRQTDVLVLLASFCTVIIELVALFELIAVDSKNISLGKSWAPSAFYLQLGVLCSTVSAFGLNLFGNGDAQTLTDMQVTGMKRKVILVLFQLFYAFAIALNVAAFVFVYGTGGK